MPYCIATTQPVWWAVGVPVVATGITPVGSLTVTGLMLFSDASENDFLGAVAGSAGDFLPLPDAGGWCEAGIMYSYGGDLVICRQSHSRTEHEPADIPALFAVYREEAGEALDWVAGEQVYIGTRRLFDGTLYECLQAHQSQSDWTPPATVGTLWGVVTTTNEWAIGVAYAVNDRVTYSGSLWNCDQAHTSISTWHPGAAGVYLWSEVV